VLSACAQVDIKPDLAPLSAAVGDRAGGALTIRERTDLELLAPLLAKPLSIETAVQTALLASPVLQAHYAELGIAQAELAEAVTLENPIVEVMLRPTTDPADLANLEFGLTQNLLNVFTRAARRTVAESAFEAETLRIANDVVAVTADVRRAYVDAVAARLALAAHRDVVAATDAAASLAESLHAAGNLSDLELAEHRATHEESALAADRAELDLAETDPTLSRLIGVTDRAIPVLDRLPHPAGPESAPGSLEAVALERRLDLGAHRHAAEAARADLKAQVDWRLWQEIEAGLSAEREGDGQWAIGPNIAFSLPVFDQGRPAVARAAAALVKAENDLRHGEDTVRTEVRAAARRVAIARRLADRLRDAVLPLKSQIVELRQREYNFMLVGAFELLEAKREESAAAAEYVEALHEYWLARVDLAQAIGGADLRLPSAEEASS
jgi:cobalt-zinc-cadmium efflux system outer membrane protein